MRDNHGRWVNLLAENDTEVVPPKPKLEDGFADEDIRRLLHSSDTATVLFPLSDCLKIKLGSSGRNDPSDLYSNVSSLLKRCEVLWTGPSPLWKTVFKLDSDTVVKAVRLREDFTEYTTLLYLQEHLPNFPAPRALGVVRVGMLILLFMSCVPGTTLGAVWTQLNHTQKASVQGQLEELFVDLRSLGRPEGMPLGGVAGEGCKDLRKMCRRSSNAITTFAEFEDFQFSNPHYGSPIYNQFVRQFSLTSSSKCAFTHGDVRPDNIMVELTAEGGCVVTGLIDWEYSGFYPDHHEATKITNCLATNEDSDWYFYLPPCISPARYPLQWLLDRLWSPHIQ